MKGRSDTKSGLTLGDIVIFATSALLLFYTGIRAANLSFTIDESLSYNVYAKAGFMDIVSYEPASSNNHMLNSLCLHYISMLLGNSEFLLRLPSLISHFFYIIFTYKIIRNLTTPFIALTGFFLLNLNPFMLDFFSLARGYGMAVTFSAASVYFLFSYVEKRKSNSLVWCLGLATLAVISNFSLSVFYVSLISVINIYWISYRRTFRMKDFLRDNIPVLICTLILVVIMFEPIRKLLKYHEFYDGGEVGLWADTVGSVIISTLYGQPYKDIAYVLLQYFIGTSILVMVITIVFELFSGKKGIFTSKGTLSLLLLFLTCVVSKVQHLLMNSLFLINRQALFLIPLFFVPFLIIISGYSEKVKVKPFIIVLMVIISGAAFLNTVNSLNTSYTLLWKYDADTKSMLSDLENEVNKENKALVKLGVMWLYEPTANFYRVTKKYDWLEKVTNSDYRIDTYDYFFLADSSLRFIKERNLTIIKQYPTSNSFFVK